MQWLEPQKYLWRKSESLLEAIAVCTQTCRPQIAVFSFKNSTLEYNIHREIFPDTVYSHPRISSSIKPWWPEYENLKGTRIRRQTNGIRSCAGHTISGIQHHVLNLSHGPQLVHGQNRQSHGLQLDTAVGTLHKYEGRWNQWIVSQGDNDVGTYFVLYSRHLYSFSPKNNDLLCGVIHSSLDKRKRTRTSVNFSAVDSYDNIMNHIMRNGSVRPRMTNKHLYLEFTLHNMKRSWDMVDYLIACELQRVEESPVCIKTVSANLAVPNKLSTFSVSWRRINYQTFRTSCVKYKSILVEHIWPTISCVTYDSYHAYEEPGT